MRIAVISPHTSNNGNTTLAMLIGFQLSSTGKSTCIGHIKPISNSFYSYLGLEGYEDKTSTPSQIVKLIKEGGLSGDDVHDYCKKIADDYEAFTNNAANFEIEDMKYMLEYMAKSFPHENVVFDIDDNNIEHMKSVVDLCDVVVLNITQSITELNNFRDNKDEYADILMGKPIVTVINKYNSIKCNMKDVAKMIGTKKPSNWVVLHENPWINWGTNAGMLSLVFTNIKKKDARVIELNSELDSIVKLISKAYTAYRSKRLGGR